MARNSNDAEGWADEGRFICRLRNLIETDDSFRSMFSDARHSVAYCARIDHKFVCSPTVRTGSE